MNRGIEKVKAWRKSFTPKLTQQALADRFGLSAMTWSRIERGEQLPPLTQAIRLEDAGICKVKDWDRPAQAEAVAEGGQ